MQWYLHHLKGGVIDIYSDRYTIIEENVHFCPQKNVLAKLFY